AVRQLRAEMLDLDEKIKSAGQQRVDLAQVQTEQYRALAEVRLDQQVAGLAVSRLDDASRRVGELLKLRDQEIKHLQEQLQQGHARQTELETQRADQQTRVAEASSALDRAEAATQKRLKEDEQYLQQLEKARRADSVAKHAEEKASQADMDRAAKCQPYESDSLFMYLWKRGYGTSAYSANPVTRLLDSWVARLCGYHDARPNYWMLNEIPLRLGEHARQERSQADAEFEALRAGELAAAEKDGIPALRTAVEEMQQRGDAMDAEIQEQEKRYSELSARQAQFLAGEDEFSRESVEVVMNQLRHEPLSELRRQAEATHDDRDNKIVERLVEAEQEVARLQDVMAYHKQIHQRQLRRLEELEQVRQNFKSQRYDDIYSSFPDGEVVGGAIFEFLRGVASSRELWEVIGRQQRYRRIESNPDFGSGGIGLPRGGVWRWPGPSSGGGGGIRRGGFRTGGSF
ncbi:MAG: hypothetical protein L0Z07_05900, partial [Planctomycetes bacterium]|nr:hypothetical protein [Planctomycetota bacterium]